MFKGFSQKQSFHGFPGISFGRNDSAYNFSRCVFWIDASYGLSSYVDGSNLSQWVEKIAGLKFLQNTGANQPFFRASDVNYNGHPVIDFSTSRYLTSLFGGVNMGRSTTLAFIANNNSLGQINYLIGSKTSSFSAVYLSGTQANIIGIGVRNNASTPWASTVEDFNTHIVVITQYNICVDGVIVLNNNSNLIYPEVELNQIGAGTNANAATYLNGKIGEILQYSYEMQPYEMIQLSDNINQKYAIY